MLYGKGNLPPMLEVHCCRSGGVGRNLARYVGILAFISEHNLPTTETEDFGYRHLLWVYSGRRGIHLWISDKEAMDLTDDQRRAIVQYIEVVRVCPHYNYVKLVQR
jgi:DNA primase small subunit